MAEAFGFVAGAISIAAVFNNCVDCFEYIQMGKSFGRDFETCQVRLDLAKVRLSRWGEAVNINSDPRFTQLDVGDPTDKLAAASLWQILVLFSESSKISKGFRLHDAGVNNPSQDLAPVPASLHEKLYRKVKLRQKSTGMFKKIAWALHQRGELQQLVDDISKITSELEQLYPAARDSIQQLAVTEIADLDEQEQQLIAEQGGGADEVLEDVTRQGDAEASHNSTGTVTLTEQAKTLVGDDYSDTAISKDYSPKQASKNSTSNVNMSGKARLQVGSRYGGKKSFMDD